MKNLILFKRIASLTVLGLVLNCSFAQKEKCAAFDYVNYLNQKHPGYRASVDAAFFKAVAAKSNKVLATNEILTIPVVVHLVYNAPEQNLDDAVVLDQIAALNDDYNRQNPDTINMRSDFDGLVASPAIQFVLATTDPNGNVTTGITRTSTTTDFARDNTNIFGFELPALATIDEVKSDTTGGKSPWDQSKYMNIWVCNMSQNSTPSLLGYATPPDSLSNWPDGATQGLGDGVVIQYQCFGRNNQNPLLVANQTGGTDTLTVLGRTVTHEVGHYLGLRHTSGDPDPEIIQPVDGCLVDDYCGDTPNIDAQSQFDCNLNQNTCVDNIPGFGDLPDMIENFMDYSAESCQNSFTIEQIGIMRNVLNDNRYDLTHSDGEISTIRLIKNDLGNNFSFLNGIKLYPNPSKGIAVLKNSTTFVYNLIVYDQIGREIMIENQVRSSSKDIDLTRYKKGVYYIKLQSQRSCLVRKLIIQ